MKCLAWWRVGQHHTLALLILSAGIFRYWSDMHAYRISSLNLELAAFEEIGFSPRSHHSGELPWNDSAGSVNQFFGKYD